MTSSNPLPQSPGTSVGAPAGFEAKVLRAWIWLTPTWFGLILVLLWSTFLLSSLQHYGMTCDLPALYYAGDRTVYWLEHLRQPGALDFAGAEPPDFHSHFERIPMFQDPMHYPVLPGFLAGVTARIFNTGLGWVDHISGHHIGLVLLNAFGLFCFCLCACRFLGKGAGFAATLALALFPCGVGHSPNDAKDWPCAVFYGATVLAAGAGVLHGRARDLLAGGALLGLAFACKFNAIFAIATIVLWTPVAYYLVYRRGRTLTPGVVGAYLIAPYVAGVVFVATWPWLYYGKVTDWWNHFSEYVSWMVNYGAQGQRPTWTAYSLKCLAFMSPPIVLLGAGIHLVRGWKGGHERAAVWSLHAIWLGLPILRIAVPHSNFYDANRHFIEYIPALCSMAGIGAVTGARWVWQRLNRPPVSTLPFLPGRLPVVAAASVAVVGLAVLVWPVAEYHPYETTYFNMFIGGLGGAQQKALFAMPPPPGRPGEAHDHRVNGTEGDFWFSSARDGARDLRALTQPGEMVSMCGPQRNQASANWGADPLPPFIETQNREWDQVRYMYMTPRETLCWWWRIRKEESERSVVKRVERGGGLVYEILGPRTPTRHPPVSPESEYELNPYFTDTEGKAWFANRKAWEESWKHPAGTP